MSSVNEEELNQLYKKLYQDAESAGYHLNPDVNFTKDLVKGLIVNEKRYGYQACPCRLATGKKSDDLDIICPCDYRDQDLNEYDACFCGLYVSKQIVDGKKQFQSIPERRPSKEKRSITKEQIVKTSQKLSKPVWRCKVCGYLCARDEPPEFCPICKVKKDRFELFMQ